MSKAAVAWDAKHTTRVAIKLNNNTDADILRHLETVGNKQGYIKRLIREDMKKEEEEKMNKTYSVTLSNSDCIFDERTGIATIEEAIQWATGRSYKYVAQFSADGRDGYAISVSCNDDDDFSIYDGWDWNSYTAVDLALHLKRNL